MQLDLLTDGGVGGRLDLLELEVLERDSAFHELLRQDLFDRVEFVLVLRGELDSVGALEVDL